MRNVARATDYLSFLNQPLGVGFGLAGTAGVLRTGKLRMGLVQRTPPATTQPVKPLALLPNTHWLLALRPLATKTSPVSATPNTANVRAGPLRTFTPAVTNTVH